MFLEKSLINKHFFEDLGFQKVDTKTENSSRKLPLVTGRRDFSATQHVTIDYPSVDKRGNCLIIVK